MNPITIRQSTRSDARELRRLADLDGARPSIGRALDFSQDNLSWVVNAYVLTFGGFLLLGGRLADLLGRRRVFMFGLVLFALASLAGGAAGVLLGGVLTQYLGWEWVLWVNVPIGLGAAALSPRLIAESRSDSI